MSIFNNIVNKIIKSLSYRAGLQDAIRQLDRIEKKVDFILHNQHLEMSAERNLADVFHPDGLSVVFISDDGYLEPTILAIFSLIRHAAPETTYNVNLVLADCSAENKTRVKNLFPQLNIIEANKPDTPVNISSHVTTAALLKFDLPNLLPQTDKVLYLDGDVLVRSDLSDLIRTPITPAACGAIIDCKAINDKYPQAAKLSIGNKYFNSGVLLLDLKEMRSKGLSAKLWQTRKSIQSHFMDQDCFNIVFAENVHLLPLHYNVMAENIALSSFTPMELGAIYNLTEKQVKETLNNPPLIHFSTPKPWKNSYTLGYEYYWQEKCLFDLWQSSTRKINQ